MRMLRPVVLSLLLAGGSEAALRVSPVRTRLEVPPGGHAASSITVTNEGDAPVAVRVGVVDWTVEGGSPEGLRIHPPGTRPRSCAAAIEVWPASLEVPPGRSASVSLAVHLPREAEGSCFSAVLLEATVGALALGNGAAARLGVNVAHLVTADAAGRVDFSAELLDLAVGRPDDTGDLEVLATLRNTGNAGIRPEGSFAVLDGKGRMVARIPLGASFAQPGGEIRLRERWEGRLEPGDYRLVGTLDLGGGRFLTPEKTFRVADHVEVASLGVTLSEGAPRATLRLANPGNVTHFLSGEVEVFAEDGRVVSKAGVAPFLVLPGRETDATVELPANAAKGRRLSVCLSDDRVTVAAEGSLDLR